MKWGGVGDVVISSWGIKLGWSVLILSSRVPKIKKFLSFLCRYPFRTTMNLGHFTFGNWNCP